MIKQSGAYQGALHRVQNDQMVIDALGTPLEEGLFMSGNINVSGPSGQASISFPVKGPKGTGNVICEATKTHDVWNYTYLAVDLKETGNRIVLIGGEGM